VKVIDWPTSAAVRDGVRLAWSGSGGRTTVTLGVCPPALPPRGSVAVTEGKYVPAVEYLWVTLEPVAVGEESPKFQTNEYGEPAPPLALPVNVNVVAVSPLVGETSAVTLMSEIVTDVESDADPPFPSVTVTVA